MSSALSVSWTCRLDVAVLVAYLWLCRVLLVLPCDEPKPWALRWFSLNRFSSSSCLFLIFFSILQSALSLCALHPLSVFLICFFFFVGNQMTPVTPGILSDLFFAVSEIILLCPVWCLNTCGLKWSHMSKVKWHHQTLAAEDLSKLTDDLLVSVPPLGSLFHISIQVHYFSPVSSHQPLDLFS